MFQLTTTSSLVGYQSGYAPEVSSNHFSASGNCFNGSIPIGLFYCGALQKLGLSSNQLSDKVPEAVWKTMLINDVDLWNNRLTAGSLRDTISSNVRLGNNQFVGRIPSTALALLYLTANNNQFSGCSESSSYLSPVTQTVSSPSCGYWKDYGRYFISLQLAVSLGTVKKSLSPVVVGKIMIGILLVSVSPVVVLKTL